MAFSEFFMGKPAETMRINTQTPQQEALQKRLMDLLGPQLSQLTSGSNVGDAFEPIAAQARAGFKQKTIPSIMERFAATDSLESSALPQMLGGAGTDLETSLAALRSQYGLQHESQQQGNLMNLLSMILRPQFEPLYQPRQPGMFESAGPTVLRSLLKLLI